MSRVHWPPDTQGTPPLLPLTHWDGVRETLD